MGTVTESSPAALTRGFAWVVLATAVAVWTLVVVGGAVRVSESGLGCPDWPLCDGRVVPTGQQEPIVEYTHRAIAGVAIGLLALTSVWALRRHRSRRDVTVPVTVALALVPVQALLGAVVVWLELPDRLVGVHFMVGMVMLALCTYACAAAWRGERSVTSGFRRVAVSVGAVGLLLVSLGAAVVSTDAMHACGEEWPACNGGFARGGDLAALQVAHRSAAYLLAVLALALLVVGVRTQASLVVSALPAALVLVQICIGVGMVLADHGSGAHDVLRILHVAGAASLWAAVVAAVGVATTVPAQFSAKRPAGDSRAFAGARARRIAT